MWFELGARGAMSHLWVVPDGPSRPSSGDWVLPDGRLVRDALLVQPPSALGIELEWRQEPGTRGSKITDILWDSSMSGVKIVSERLTELLTGLDSTLRTETAVVRLESGELLPGYHALDESRDPASPVHSLLPDRRGSHLVVAPAIAEAVKAGKFIGLDLSTLPGEGPFLQVS